MVQRIVNFISKLPDEVTLAAGTRKEAHCLIQAFEAVCDFPKVMPYLFLNAAEHAQVKASLIQFTRFLEAMHLMDPKFLAILFPGAMYAGIAQSIAQEWKMEKNFAMLPELSLRTALLIDPGAESPLRPINLV